MPELIGADVERLRSLASSVDERAEAVRSLERRVSTACGELSGFWHGADAADFLGRWQSSHRPQLLAVAAGLVDASQLLSANADEQEKTSSDTAGSAWGGIGDFVSDRWDDVTSTVDAVADETVHRLSEFGQYALAYTDRWLDNPVQSVFDELTLTAPFERLVGAGSILFLGGEFQENIDGGDAEFITGLPIKFNDAITLGHTVFVDDARPSGGLLEHELQHVADVEDVGGVAFYSSYLGNWIGNIIAGQDPSLGGEAYENIWWEQRAEAAQDGNQPFDLDFGRFDPRNWFD